MRCSGLGEYANILLMCAMGTILFLGGWLPIVDIYPINYTSAYLDDIKNFIFIFLFALIKSNRPKI